MAKKITFIILFTVCVFIDATHGELHGSQKIHKYDVAVSENDWWTNAVFYQIYPRSFQDSDADGNGDLQGMHIKLKHLIHSFIYSVTKLYH